MILTSKERYEWACRYYAAWLGIPPEEFSHARGVKLYANPARAQKISVIAKPLPFYAIRMEDALLMACVPQWESRLRAQVAGRDIPGAMEALETLFGDQLRKGLSHWLGQLNEAIDTTEAAALTQEDFPAYLEFMQAAHDRQEEEFLRRGLPEYFRGLAEQRKCFGVWRDGKLASVADGPEQPYLPEVITDPGIVTLPEYRGRGYASAVCAALLRRQLDAGMVPIWSCAADNAASVALARKLGFQPFCRRYNVRGEVDSFDITKP